MTYYCKNCNNMVGELDDEYECFNEYCNYFNSKNFNKISFLDCKNCNKFVGIKCYDICENCFEEDLIFGEENLFNWFLKYKKIIQENLNHYKICNNKYNFRHQFWFFEELTFYK